MKSGPLPSAAAATTRLVRASTGLEDETLREKATDTNGARFKKDLVRENILRFD